MNSIRSSLYLKYKMLLELKVPYKLGISSFNRKQASSGTMNKSMYVLFPSLILDIHIYRFKSKNDF